LLYGELVVFARRDETREPAANFLGQEHAFLKMQLKIDSEMIVSNFGGVR